MNKIKNLRLNMNAKLTIELIKENVFLHVEVIIIEYVYNI